MGRVVSFHLIKRSIRITGDLKSVQLEPTAVSGANLNISDFDLATTFDIVCFSKGQISTSAAIKPALRMLHVDDLVRTIDHGLQQIRWIGETTVMAKGDLAPIEFMPGVIGNTRELVVSPQHRILIKDWRTELVFGEPEVLIAAKYLVNCDTIMFAKARR